MYRRLLLAAVLTLGLVGPGPALALETAAEHAIVIDATTKTILLEKKADERMYPASMTKLMTAYLVFEKLKSGELTLEQKFPVSERAWRMEGSRTFLPLGELVRVEDLIKGMIVQSGNDASVALAEGIAGSEEAFAEMMTARAAQLGMVNTSFKNTTGLPHPEHYSSARDLALLGLSLIQNFPEYYGIYSTRAFKFNNINQHNRNPLLHTVQGADGLKTGYTEQAGYGMVGSAQRDGRRILIVVAGLKTPGSRAVEARKLIESGFNEFSTPVFYREGETVVQAPVWLGNGVPSVPLVAGQNVLLTMPSSEKKDIVLKATFDSPLFAPLKKGAPAGKLEITSPRFPQPIVFPLKVGQDVGKAGIFEQIKRKLGFMLAGDMSPS